MRMRFDFEAIARKYGTTREHAVGRGFPPDELEEIERGDAADIHLSTYVRLCHALGCCPGELPLCVDERGDDRGVPDTADRDRPE